MNSIDPRFQVLVEALKEAEGGIVFACGADGPCKHCRGVLEKITKALHVASQPTTEIAGMTKEWWEGELFAAEHHEDEEAMEVFQNIASTMADKPKEEL